MNLSGLLAALRPLPGYPATLTALMGDQAASHGLALNLPRAARAPFAAALAGEASRDAPRPILVISARPDRALTLVEEIGAWSNDLRVLQFNEPNPVFYEPAAWGARITRARIAVLSALASLASPFLTNPNSAQAFPLVIITSARALMTRTLPRREFLIQTRTLKVGQTVRLEKLIEAWVEIGYSAESIVVEPGQFSRRGGLLDIYPMADELPARIELFGDEIETLRRFDPAQQRSGEKIEALTITPAREGLPKFSKAEGRSTRQKDESANEATSSLTFPLSSLEFQIPLMYPPASLIEYLPEQALVLVDDWQELADIVGELEEHAVQQRGEQMEAGLLAEDFPVPYLTWSELQDELAGRPLGVLSARADEDGPTLPLGANFQPGPRFGGQLKPVLEHLQTIHASGEQAVVVSRQAQRLAELWSERNTPVRVTENIKAPPAPGEMVFVEGALSDGWVLKAEGRSARLKDEAAGAEAGIGPGSMCSTMKY